MTVKQKVDTPRKNAWHTQVNKENFIPEQEKPDRVVIRTINAAEYRELAPIFNGRT